MGESPGSGKGPAVRIEVSGTVATAAPRALEALRDYARFGAWWHVRAMPCRGRDDAVWVRPLPWVWILMVRRPHPEPGHVTYDYARGPFRGRGTWLVTPDASHPERCTVSYTIELEPVNWLVRILSGTRFFRARHRADIRQILGRLERL